MSHLFFELIDVQPEKFAAVPTLRLRLRVREASGVEVHSVALQCTLRIEPLGRRYSPAEEERLVELFGETPRWGDTAKPFLWSQSSLVVRGFENETEVDLAIPCTYDFDVAAAKYLHALDEGAIPIRLFLTGTVFARGERGLEVTPLPWDREAAYRLPVSVWRDLMNLYFPDGGWLRLRRDTLSALLRYKADRSLPTWDGVVSALLQSAGGSASGSGGDAR